MTMATAPERRPDRPWYRSRMLNIAFGTGILALLGWAAGKVDWAKVWEAMQGIPSGTLLAAAAVGAASHATYTTFDLLGRAWTGHRLSWPRVVRITFVCYAFNLNLGSLIGGIGLRLKLYSRWGITTEQTGQIVAMSMTTNWLGYGALAGGVFLMGWFKPPANSPVGADALPWLGTVLWTLTAAYLALCLFGRERRFTIRGHAFTVPPWRLALLQLGLSCLNWLLMACMVWLLMQGRVAYPQVLSTLLAAALAGVALHVPAGLGVLEAVFVAVLSPPETQATLLASLLAYRALYYLLPLCLAAMLYFVLEVQAGRNNDDTA